MRCVPQPPSAKKPMTRCMRPTVPPPAYTVTPKRRFMTPFPSPMNWDFVTKRSGCQNAWNISRQCFGVSSRKQIANSNWQLVKESDFGQVRIAICRLLYLYFLPTSNMLFGSMFSENLGRRTDVECESHPEPERTCHQSSTGSPCWPNARYVAWTLSCDSRE